MSFEDFVFTDRLSTQLSWFLDNPGRTPNVLCFYGEPGIGKTSFARFLANTICGTHHYHDLSTLDLGNPFFKSMKRTCSTVGLFGAEDGYAFNRGVILDEFHDLRPKDQDRFKYIVEEFSGVLFIICLNTSVSREIGKVLTPAIQSRCHLVDFNVLNSEREALAIKVQGKFSKLTYEQIFRLLPDMRRITREPAIAA